MQERVPASRLQSIQSEIARLQSEKERLEERCRFPLSVRDRIEQDIARLIQLDPANIKLKTDGLKVKARRLAREQIQERVKQLERETQDVRRKKDEAQRQLEIEERKLEALNSQLREVNRYLQQLENNDPANVGVMLSHLRNSWKGISQVELKKLIVKGEVERLYKEQLLLNYSIQIDSKKANQLRQVLEIPVTEVALLLEKNVLEQEKLERDLQRDLSRLSEIDTRLKWLQTERQKLGWQNGSFVVGSIPRAKPTYTPPPPPPPSPSLVSSHKEVPAWIKQNIKWVLGALSYAMLIPGIFFVGLSEDSHQENPPCISGVVILWLLYTAFSSEYGFLSLFLGGLILVPIIMVVAVTDHSPEIATSSPDSMVKGIFLVLLSVVLYAYGRWHKFDE